MQKAGEKFIQKGKSINVNKIFSMVFKNMSLVEKVLIWKKGQRNLDFFLQWLSMRLI